MPTCYFRIFVIFLIHVTVAPVCEIYVWLIFRSHKKSEKSKDGTSENKQENENSDQKKVACPNI